MTIDHLAAYKILTDSAETNEIMRMIGRIAAPLFLFLLVEGLRYTRSKEKYILRLYIAGVAVQIIREITAVFYTGTAMGNIFQTFFYTAFYITCIDIIIKNIKSKKNIFMPVILALVPVIFIFINQNFINILFPSPFSTEYSFLFVLLGIIWYFINDKYINCAVFAVLSVICGIVERDFIYNLPYFKLFTFHHLFANIQWIMIAAIPFMLLYNGKKGNKSKNGVKYIFYIYYPAHQYLFFIISVYLLRR